MTSKPKHIIFDLGGVILDIDYNRPVEALKKKGIHIGSQIFSIQNPDPVYALYETGQLNTDEFLSYLAAQSPQPVTHDELIVAWNSILVNLPLHRILMLRNIKNEYDTFLLSNINEMHIEAFDKMYATHFPKSTFANELDKIYYSCRIGFRKPEPQAFKYILQDQGINPEDTLFADDSLTHIQQARLLGLQTYHISPSTGQSFEALCEFLVR